MKITRRQAPRFFERRARRAANLHVRTHIVVQRAKRKSPDPVANLKKENAALKGSVRALKSETAKLQTKYARLEAKHFSALARVKALEKLKVPPEPKPLSDREVARRIAFLLYKGGLDTHGNPLPKK